MITWPDLSFGPINLWSVPKMDDDQLKYEPEGCDECGMEAGDFGEEDWDSGHWKCPDCGAVC